MRKSKDAEIREAKKFLAQWSARHRQEAYLNMSCLPRAP
jgi:hypothetical protein